MRCSVAFHQLLENADQLFTQKGRKGRLTVACQREMDPLHLLHDIDLEQPSTYLSIILTSVPVITVTLNGFSEIVRGIVEPRLDKIVKV